MPTTKQAERAKEIIKEELKGKENNKKDDRNINVKIVEVAQKEAVARPQKQYELLRKEPSESLEKKLYNIYLKRYSIDPTYLIPDLLRKRAPWAVLPAQMLVSSFMYSARAGEPESSFLGKYISHFIPPEALTTAAISLYALSKAPYIFGTLYGRSRPLKIFAQYGNIPLIEHLYQAYRTMYLTTYAAFLPSLYAYSLPLLYQGIFSFLPNILSTALGIIGKGLPFGNILTAPGRFALGTISNLASTLPISTLGHIGSAIGKFFNPYIYLYKGLYYGIYRPLGNILGISKVLAPVGTALSHVPLLGSFISGISSPYMLGAILTSFMGMGISMARAFAYRKYRPRDINVFELEQKTAASQQLQPFLMQVVTKQKQVDPISVLQLQTLMLIEQHTSMVPLIYKILHDLQEVKQKSTELASDTYKMGIYGKREKFWFERVQKPLERLLLRYNPLTQIITYLTTGMTPQEYITRYLMREEITEATVEKAKERLGLSWQLTTLLGTSAASLLNKAKTFEGKLLSLLAGIYDVLRGIFAEVVTIRKGGFGIEKAISFSLPAGPETKTFMENLLNFAKSTVFGLGKLSLKFNFNLL